MDFNWNPKQCLSCQYQDCSFCIKIPMQEIDLRSLIKYTYLSELWEIFLTMISISPSTDHGLTINNAGLYLDGVTVQVTHQEFWWVITYFLGRMNEKFREKQKAALAKKGRK